MKIKEILKYLGYYLSIRQTGKTTLLKMGVDEYPRQHFILVPSLDYGQKIFGKTNKLHNFVTLNTLNKLIGTHQAIAIDHQVDMMVYQMSLEEIEKLELENDRKLKLAHDLTDLLEIYQHDLHSIQTHIMEGLDIPVWNLIRLYRHRQKEIELAGRIIENGKKYMEQFRKIKTNYKFVI
jgi:hypothetical protein